MEVDVGGTMQQEKWKEAYVRGLEVTMHDMICMQKVDGLGKLAE